MSDIRKYFKGVNFITPRVIEHCRSGAFMCELSKGKPVLRKEGHIYGVTVLMGDGSQCDLSDSFSSEEDAREYIKKIGKIQRIKIPMVSKK